MNTFAVVFFCLQTCLVQNTISQSFNYGAEMTNKGSYGYGPELAIVPSAITLSPDYRNAAGLGYTNLVQKIPGVFNDAIVENAFFGVKEGISAYTNGMNGVPRLLSNARVAKVNTSVGAREGNVAVAGKLPIAGKTAVIGQLPILGAVSLGGNLPASAAMSVNARCTCLC